MANTPAITPERQVLLETLASQAAAWWRTRLEGPGYLSKFDNGDRSEAGETAQVLASLAALQTPPAPASRYAHFEQLLAAALLARLLREPSPSRPAYAGAACCCVLRVDYGPEELLGEVAAQARVGGFPWKTTMWVNWDARPAHCYVEVRAGYGRPTERLPAPALA